MEKSTFNKSSFLKLAIPSYLIPLAFSGTSGLLLNKPELIKASYSTIALASLLATVACFTLLWQLQKRQLFLVNRFIMTLILVLLMVFLSLGIIYGLRLEKYIWDILPSVIIGSAIVTLTQPLKKH